MEQPASARSDFSVVRLDSRKAATVFPLVQALLPTLKLSAWLQYVAELETGAPEEQGVLTVEDGRGYVFGLACYSCARDLQYGRVLWVRNFVSFDLGDRWQVADCLIANIEAVAAKLQCRAARVILPETAASHPRTRDTVASKFRRHGYEMEAAQFVRILTAATEGAVGS